MNITRAFGAIRLLVLTKPFGGIQLNCNRQGSLSINE